MLAAASTTAKTAMSPTRSPAAHQPSRPGSAAATSRNSHAFTRLAATARPIAGRSVVVFALVLDEPAWRPVRLRGVAAARAVQRRDVLQWDQDVAVQLDVRHVVDGAVRGEDAILIVTAEERDLHLLALVLAGVVLHVARGYLRRRQEVAPVRADCAADVREGVER